MCSEEATRGVIAATSAPLWPEATRQEHRLAAFSISFLPIYSGATYSRRSALLRDAFPSLPSFSVPIYSGATATSSTPWRYFPSFFLLFILLPISVELLIHAQKPYLATSSFLSLYSRVYLQSTHHSSPSSRFQQ